eukprot:scaffold193839_cov36-Prasinocladus_malaysianus.AAC.1
MFLVQLQCLCCMYPLKFVRCSFHEQCEARHFHWLIAQRGAECWRLGTYSSSAFALPRQAWLVPSERGARCADMPVFALLSSGKEKDRPRVSPEQWKLVFQH